VAEDLKADEFLCHAYLEGTRSFVVLPHPLFRRPKTVRQCTEVGEKC